MKLENLPARVLNLIAAHLTPKYTKRLVQSSKIIQQKLQSHYKILRIIEDFDYLNPFLHILQQPQYQKYLFIVTPTTTKVEILAAMKRHMLKFQSLNALYSKHIPDFHKKYPELFKIVLEDVDFDITPSPDSMGRACYWGHVEIVELMLNNGADPSELDNAAIRMAAKYGHYNILKILIIDRRVDPAANDNFAILWACTYGHLNCVIELLKDKRVDPTVRDNLCLIKAVKHGFLDIVKLLLNDTRVDPTAQDNAAWIIACSYGRFDVVRLLLDDFRINPTIEDNAGIKNAAKQGHKEIVKFLLSDDRIKSTLRE